MAQKNPQKKVDITIDEEKDVYLSFLNKKIRNAKKKLEQIEDLEKRDKSALKAEQLEKLKSKAETEQIVRHNESLKETYYVAFKAARDEGKAEQTDEPKAKKKVPKGDEKLEEKKEETRSPLKETKSSTSATQQVETQTHEDKQIETKRIARENLSKVINLVHFVQFFRDRNRVQEFRQAFESRRDTYQFDFPDFESLLEFYVKVFTFSERDKLVKVEEKTNKSLDELELYINSVDQPALKNKTYKHLQTVVEGIASSPFFKDHSADVGVAQASLVTEPSAIGSELRKGHDHQEKIEEPIGRGSPQKRENVSPEKETRGEQKTYQEAQQSPEKNQEGRKDWADEDEDDDDDIDQLREEQDKEANFEGEGGRSFNEDDQPYPTLKHKLEEEEQKAKQEDDGFRTVQSKKKEKKEEPLSGSGQYRGSRRGGRGDRPRGDRPYKPKYEGEEGEEEGGSRGGYRGGQQTIYREKKPRKEFTEGETRGEGERDEKGFKGEGERGGYRGGGRGGYRGGYKGEGYRGEGGSRGGQGGYRGESGRGNTRGSGRGGKDYDKPRDFENKPREEFVKKDNPPK